MEGDVSVAVLHESVDVMEIDSQVRIESTNGEHCTDVGADTESCSKEVAKEACYGTEMGPCAASIEMDVVLENTGLDCSDKFQTNEVSNDTETRDLVKSHVKDVASSIEPNGCSDIQVKEVGNSAELEACTGSHAKEVLVSTELPPFAESRENETVDEHCMKKLRKQSPNDANVEPKEVMHKSKIEPCAQNQASDMLYDCNLELICGSNEVRETVNHSGMDSCPNNKEPSNDDIHSEVSNPNQSPKHATSSLTISSQLHEVRINDGCGEITSPCSRYSTVDVSFRKAEDNSNHKMNSVSKSCVVLEIPKHVSTTGIRKITFKFSKCKEDYDDIGQSVVKPMADDEFQEELHDYQLFDSQPVTNSLQNYEWNALENAEMNLTMDGTGSGGTQSPFSCILNRELKMSKKIIPDNYPTNVKKLLSTRILEGARVKYISMSGRNEIPGIIRDCGYLCGCSLCNFSKHVVSAYEFELHAGTKTRHPNNHIYLENGKPIYSIIQELKTASLSTLDDVIKAVAGSSVNEEYFQLWIDSEIANFAASLLRGNDAAANIVYQSRDFGVYHSTSSHPCQPTEESHGSASCYYSEISPFNQETYVEAPIERKRLSKKFVVLPVPRLVLPSLRLMLDGQQNDNRGYRHIYTSSGLTLHDIALMLASGQNLATSGSDDMCAVCGACLGLPRLPEDDWQCPYCREKFVPGKKASGGSRHVIVRQRRVVKAPELEPGGCVFCRSQDFSAAKFDDRTVILCDQCEKEYHVGCLRESGLCDLQELPKDKWFCSPDCSNIFSVLQNMTCSEPESGLMCNIYILEFTKVSPSVAFSYLVIYQGVISVKSSARLQTLFAEEFECFDPIVAKSGRDLIPVMVYGRNISGQEFGGMYCVVLIVKSIVVSAALLRIFGREVAELPLVATCKEKQGKGYFQALFSCIERLLSSMNVKHLVLPAAEEAEPMWMNKLGFRKTSNEQMLKYTRDFQLTMFKGTSLLEKEVRQLAG
ncbi:hypothetical protein DH2020_025973 [Rehmannia glutinosa]|uniref:Zinc finger PHD-type domain-containing protein n=1 Tax=Rehmannia glutinosa TaxID=99300 RepID=A0ABR0W214_REHGL